MVENFETGKFGEDELCNVEAAKVRVRIKDSFQTNW